MQSYIRYSLFLLTLHAMWGSEMLLSAQTNAASSWRIVASEKTDKQLLDLPPLAVVANRDDSGKTWRIEGCMNGTQAVAESDFKLAFERQGWRLDKTIPLGQGQQILLLWRRGGSSIILMLHETAVAKTEFAVGLDNHPAKPVQPSHLTGNLTETQTGTYPQ
jgi:hypothetical protein